MPTLADPENYKNMKNTSKFSSVKLLSVIALMLKVHMHLEANRHRLQQASFIVTDRIKAFLSTHARNIQWILGLVHAFRVCASSSAEEQRP